MRRLCNVVSRRAAPAVAASTARSFVEAPSVQSAIARHTIGVPVTREQIAEVCKVSLESLDKVANPRRIAYTQMELARRLYAPLIATITDEVDYGQLKRRVAERWGGDAAKLQPVIGASKKFKETPWKDMTALMVFYEEVMLPIRRKHLECEKHKLTGFHIQDVLKRGLSSFKQNYLDQQKQELVAVKTAIQECEQFIQLARQEAFDTALCNDLANLLRIGGERHEHAHRMCLKVLEDMNLMRVPYDSITREILRAAVFGDGPFDNSDLLFELIECPERGEISLSSESLEKVSDDILKVISQRHQTPLDEEGVLLRSSETHPNLQCSPE